MLEHLNMGSLDELVDRVIPGQIRMDGPLKLPAALTESQALAALRARAEQNEVFPVVHWDGLRQYAYAKCLVTKPD